MMDAPPVVQRRGVQCGLGDGGGSPSGPGEGGCPAGRRAKKQGSSVSSESREGPLADRQQESRDFSPLTMRN